MFAIVAAIFAGWPGASSAQWVNVADPFPGTQPSTCLLLTDGAVMCHQGSTNTWHKLTPDIFGSYVNGTWSTLATMPDGTDTSTLNGGCAPCVYAPTYFASVVLADGRVVVIGGEYATNGQTWTNIGFMYDPVADSWSAQLNEAFGTGAIGDTSAAVLPDGTMLLADINTGDVESFDPDTLTFTALGATGKLDRNNEENWNLLPDGRILTVDSRIQTSFEIYDPAANTWGDSGSTVVNLADCCGSGAYGNSKEVGPGVVRPDGTLIYFSGAPTGQNAVYDISADTWSNTAAMDFPMIGGQQYSVPDGPASLLPNGNVLVMASPQTIASTFNTPSHFFEWDGTNLTQVADSAGAANLITYQGRMLLLPTGEVLLTANDQGGSTNVVQVYQSAGGPEEAWRPVITGGPRSIEPGTTYTISGRMFNGFSEGASYGDDAQMSTNYPLVRIRNRATGHVFYARTHHHSRMGIVEVGSTEIVSTQFDTPPGMESGLSDLEVVVNGIASRPLVVNGPGLTLPGPLSLEACVGTTANATLNVCNTGSQNLAINNITSSNPQFTVDTPSSGYSVIISPDFCFPFQAHYTPTAPGATLATLTISSNDPSYPNATLSISGNSGAPQLNAVIANSGSFGDVCTGDQADLNLQLLNQGTCNLSISGVTSSSAAFELPQGTSFPLVLSHDANVTLPIRFKPTGTCSDSVARTANITINSNDLSNPALVRAVSGIAPCPDINVAIADSGSFGSVCKGDQGDLDLTLFNQGKCDLTITSLALAPDPDSFELPADLQLPLVLSHDADFTVPIRYSPQECFSGKPETRTLEIASDDPDEATLGIGLSARSPCPNVIIDPGSLSLLHAFPATVVDTTGTLGCYTDRTAVLRNVGQCPATISSITASAADFTVTAPTQLPLILPPGEETLSVGVRFTPQADANPLAPSEVTGLLSVVSDDPTGPDQAGLCGESAARSGVRILVTDVTTGLPTPVASVDSLTLSSQGVTPRTNLRFTDHPVSSTTVCGNPVQWHVDQESLPAAGTTGNNPRGSYQATAKEGNLQNTQTFSLGQCQLREFQLQLRDTNGGSCQLLPKGASCTNAGECCSGKCTGPSGGETCK